MNSNAIDRIEIRPAQFGEDLLTLDIPFKEETIFRRCPTTGLMSYEKVRCVVVKKGGGGVNKPSTPLVVVMSVMGPWLLCKIERGEAVLRMSH